MGFCAVEKLCFNSQKINLLQFCHSCFILRLFSKKIMSIENCFQLMFKKRTTEQSMHQNSDQRSRANMMQA